jgi:hypothetical protein
VHAAPSDRRTFHQRLWTAALLNDQPILRHGGNTLADGLAYLGCSNRTARGSGSRPLYGQDVVHDGSGAIGLYEDACGRPLGYVEAHINPCGCRGSAVSAQAAGA